MTREVYYQLSNGEWSVPHPHHMDSPGTLVLTFGGRNVLDDHSAITELRKVYPLSHIIGCSTSGEIVNHTVMDEVLAVAVAKFDRTGLRSACAPVATPEDSHSAGQAIARELHAPDLRGIFVVSDGLSVNGSRLVAGINSVVDESVAVTGGLAGDADRFEATWVTSGIEPVQKHVVAVGFYGDDVVITHGSEGGWSLFGPERRVTRSKDNILFEVDGQPALELYKKYLGDRADGLPATALLFPLSLRANESDSKRVVRTILAVDEAEQSMTFAGDVPEGMLVQLMFTSHGNLVEGAAEAAERAAINSGDGCLSIAISCVGRRLVLGDNVDDELEAVMHSLPKGSQQVGFYSYGEIAPFSEGYCDLHNQTMTLTVLAEHPQTP